MGKGLGALQALGMNTFVNRIKDAEKTKLLRTYAQSHGQAIIQRNENRPEK